jgi:hypothetical protein
MYSDRIPSGFKVGELTLPFRRLPQAHRVVFIRHGIDALMIDRFSHVSAASSAEPSRTS